MSIGCHCTLQYLMSHRILENLNSPLLYCSAHLSLSWTCQSASLAHYCTLDHPLWLLCTTALVGTLASPPYSSTRAHQFLNFTLFCIIIHPFTYEDKSMILTHRHISPPLCILCMPCELWLCFICLCLCLIYFFFQFPATMGIPDFSHQWAKPSMSPDSCKHHYWLSFSFPTLHPFKKRMLLPCSHLKLSPWCLKPLRIHLPNEPPVILLRSTIYFPYPGVVESLGLTTKWKMPQKQGFSHFPPLPLSHPTPEAFIWIGRGLQRIMFWWCFCNDSSSSDVGTVRLLAPI